MTDSTFGNLNTLEEARKRLGGVGSSTLFTWIKDGRIRALKIGSRTFITDAEINRVIHEANALAAEKADARRQRHAA